MNFTCDNEELLKNMKKFLRIIGKEFSTEPTFENEYGTHLKSEIKENKTHFHNNETAKKDNNYRCSGLIRIEFFLF